jgi:hypothetical protein
MSILSTDQVVQAPPTVQLFGSGSRADPIIIADDDYYGSGEIDDPIIIV